MSELFKSVNVSDLTDGLKAAMLSVAVDSSFITGNKGGVIGLHAHKGVVESFSFSPFLAATFRLKCETSQAEDGFYVFSSYLEVRRFLTSLKRNRTINLEIGEHFKAFDDNFTVFLAPSTMLARSEHEFFNNFDSVLNKKPSGKFSGDTLVMAPAMLERLAGVAKIFKNEYQRLKYCGAGTWSCVDDKFTFATTGITAEDK